MSKQPKDKYTNIDTVIDQGIKSKYQKAVDQIDKAEELIPTSGYEGSSEDINKAIRHYQEGIFRLTELLAYRKIGGID